MTRNSSNSDRPFLTVPEVAVLLGVSVPRAYQLAAEGAFPSIRLSPRRIRVPANAFEAWVATQSERALETVASCASRSKPEGVVDPAA